jgi:malate synthase
MSVLEALENKFETTTTGYNIQAAFFAWKDRQKFKNNSRWSQAKKKSASLVGRVYTNITN